MLEVENLSPFTRAFSVDGKEYIFRANQIRNDIPNNFLNSNGTIKFAGLIKLKRIILEDGSSKRAYNREHVDNLEVYHNQKWKFIFENVSSGEKLEIIKLDKFCKANGLNVTSIRPYIISGKVYKGWKITRELLNNDSQDNLDEKLNSDEIIEDILEDENISEDK